MDDLVWFGIFVLFFDHTQGMWKCPGQGWNPRHSSDSSLSSDNAGSLTTRPSGNSWSGILRNQQWWWAFGADFQRERCLTAPSGLSCGQVSLDSRVRELIDRNMAEPSPHIFDDAQLQIYTLMHRDSYPRFLSSTLYKDLLRALSERSVEA